MESEEPNPRPDEEPSEESLRIRRRYARLAGSPIENRNDWERVWHRDEEVARRLVRWLVVLVGVGVAVVAFLRR